MAETCRCHLALDAPDGPHWWPSREPEPDTGVAAVAVAGQDPGFLRAERRPDGWHTEGHAAAYPEVTPSHGWDDVGRCWAGAHHPVVDVSDWLARHTTSNHTTTRRPSLDRAWSQIDGVVTTVPVIVRQRRQARTRPL